MVCGVQNYYFVHIQRETTKNRFQNVFTSVVSYSAISRIEWILNHNREDALTEYIYMYMCNIDI